MNGTLTSSNLCVFLMIFFKKFFYLYAMYVRGLHNICMAELPWVHRTFIFGMNLNCLYAGPPGLDPGFEPRSPGEDARLLTVHILELNKI